MSARTVNITLNGDTDANDTIVNNLGQALVKKISVKLEGKEVISLDDADIYLCYRDLSRDHTGAVLT